MQRSETGAAAGTRRNLSDEDLTQAVVASFDAAPNARTREVLQSLVRHLHAFASEVQLTEEEWARGVDFLTRTGQISSDKRQEFILLSDVLGLSMLTIGINHRVPSGATESTVFGPFFVDGTPGYENGDDIANGQSGEPCLIEGTVRSTDGDPIAGARIEVWQADEDGFYDVQLSDLDGPQGRGHLPRPTTGASGSGRSGPRRTRSPPTARSASCSRRRRADRCVPPTCTS